MSFLDEFFDVMKKYGLGTYYPNNEPEEYFFKRNIANKSNPIVFDVGANVGNFTKIIKHTKPDSTVYCFEPNKKAFSDLCKVEGENIFLHNVAVSDEVGKRIFYVPGTPGASTEGSTFYKETISNPVPQNVHTITIDSFCKENNIEKIDFLKVDVEGHELSVFRGAREMIKAKKISAVMFEFNEHNIKSRTFFKDIWDELDGFTLGRVIRDTILVFGEYSPQLCEQFNYQTIAGVLNGEQFYSK